MAGPNGVRYRGVHCGTLPNNGGVDGYLDKKDPELGINARQLRHLHRLGLP